MKLSYYLFLMAAAAVLSFAACVLIIFNTDPFSSGIFWLILFYLALFFGLSATLSVVGFLIRIKISGDNDPYFKIVRKSFRHSILFSFLLIGALFLQSERLLNWWNMTILILAFVFFELSFLTGGRQISK